jgi:hypothetical protein
MYGHIELFGFHFGDRVVFQVQAWWFCTLCPGLLVLGLDVAQLDQAVGLFPDGERRVS